MPAQSKSPIVISAVIPAYNREKTLGFAIESALSQTYPPEEVVVVDDGSTDGTLRVAESFGQPVKCVRGRHRGVSCARNLGASTATSDWVAFLDSDDHWVSDYLERIRSAIVATSSAAALYFADTKHNFGVQSESLWAASGFSFDGAHAFVADGTLWAMNPLHPMMLQSSVVNRKSFLESGGLSEKLLVREDSHYFFRAAIGQPVCAVRGCGAVMTDEAGEQSRLSVVRGPGSPSYLESTVWLYRDVLTRFPMLEQTHRVELQRRCARALLTLGRLDASDGNVARAARRFAQATSMSPAVWHETLMRRLKRVTTTG